MNDTTIRSRYQGYCNKCYFTIFKGERIRYNGKANHIDCAAALSDALPRTMHSKYRNINGGVSRSKMRELIEARDKSS